MKESLSLSDFFAGVGVYLFCFISSIVGEDENLSNIVLLYLAIGFVIFGIIGLDYYFLKYKRKKKVFGELTAKEIAEIIKYEGYYPKIDSDNYIRFKSNGYVYTIYYNAPRMALLFTSTSEEKGYSIALQAAAKVMNDTTISKIYVRKSPDNPNDIYITIAVETFIHYIDELKENFAIYFNIVNETVSIFNDEFIKQIEEKTQPQDAEIRQTDTKNVIVN